MKNSVKQPSGWSGRLKASAVVLIALTALCLTSCRSNPAPTIERTDAERIIETLHDTTVVVMPDRSLVKALLECDSIGQVRIRQLLEYHAGNKLKPPQLSLNDNVLTAISETDSLLIYLTLKYRYNTKQSELKKTETVFVEKELTWWQDTRIHFANLLLIILPVLALGFFIKRQFFN